MSGGPNSTRRACLEAGLALGLGLVLGLAPVRAAPAVWRDHATGLALGGTDPLSYFTLGEPRQGDPTLEHDWGDVTWRFVNDGNRAAFARHPGAYAPPFAGFDTYALSTGTVVPGYPTIWAHHDDRVYLFCTEAHRRQWAMDPQAFIGRAHERWPQAAANLPLTPSR